MWFLKVEKVVVSCSGISDNQSVLQTTYKSLYMDVWCFQIQVSFLCSHISINQESHCQFLAYLQPPFLSPVYFFVAWSWLRLGSLGITGFCFQSVPCLYLEALSSPLSFWIFLVSVPISGQIKHQLSGRWMQYVFTEHWRWAPDRAAPVSVMIHPVDIFPSDLDEPDQEVLLVLRTKLIIHALFIHLSPTH